MSYVCPHGTVPTPRRAADRTNEIKYTEVGGGEGAELSSKHCRMLCYTSPQTDFAMVFVWVVINIISCCRLVLVHVLSRTQNCFCRRKSQKGLLYFCDILGWKNTRIPSSLVVKALLCHYCSDNQYALGSGFVFLYIIPSQVFSPILFPLSTNFPGWSWGVGWMEDSWSTVDGKFVWKIL